MQTTCIDFDDFQALLSTDQYFIAVLKVVRLLMPEAYIAAGFVRNRIWDHLYDQSNLYSDLDIDVIYFDGINISADIDYQLEKKLTEAFDAPWQVRNQARMHIFGGHKPFSSLEHALKHWAETATTVGVRLDSSDKLQFIAPFGFTDLFTHTLRITPIMKRCDLEGFHNRIVKKNWCERWPGLTIVDK
jgi:hypothetical protein